MSQVELLTLCKNFIYYLVIQPSLCPAMLDMCLLVAENCFYL